MAESLIPTPAGSAVFVTGGTGHTGARLVDRLLKAGHEVRCLTRGGGRREFLPKHDKLIVIEGALEAESAAAPSWAAHLRGCAAVFHLAHMRHAPQIVAACRAAEVRRLICLSSTRRFTKFPEQTSQWVAAGEAAVGASGLVFTVLRATMIYGWERDNNIERLVRWLRRSRVVPLVRGGANLVQPVFVEDLVDALIGAMRNPDSTSGRMLTIAGPAAMPLREVIATAARGLGVRPLWIPVPFWMAVAGAAILEHLPMRAPATRDQIRRLLEDKDFDIREAREALPGWSPRPFQEGMGEKLFGAKTGQR